MNLLRSLLLMLLACAVPATALADVLHQGGCQRGSPVVSAPQADHAMQGGHSMHVQHVMAQDGSGSDTPSAPGACRCGCICGGVAHCAVGVGALLGETGSAVSRLGTDACRPMPESGQALAGHPGDFLRPPSIS